MFQGVDDDNVTEISDYSDYKVWPSYHYEDEAACYEGEVEAEKYDEKVEDEEPTRKEEGKRLKPQELIDIFADLAMQLRDKRAERIAAKAEERKEKLRQLIGVMSTLMTTVSGETRVSRLNDTLSNLHVKIPAEEENGRFRGNFNHTGRRDRR